MTTIDAAVVGVHFINYIKNGQQNLNVLAHARSCYISAAFEEQITVDVYIYGSLFIVFYLK